MEIIEDASHLCFAEQPATVNDLLNSFFGRTSRSVLTGLPASPARIPVAIQARSGYEQLMLRGEMIGLRAIEDGDIEIFEAELMNDAETRMRSDSRPFRPVAPGSPHSPYRSRDDRPDAVSFAAAELATGELVGEAGLWGIDLHNRHAHLGLTLRPAFRGKGMGTDIVRVLCHYGFVIRGLNRLQVDTLADNEAMIGAAVRAGFVREATLRSEAWVNGRFADLAILGLLAAEWQPGEP